MKAAINWCTSNIRIASGGDHDKCRFYDEYYFRPAAFRI
jgi:hypothetical protein